MYLLTFYARLFGDKASFCVSSRLLIQATVALLIHFCPNLHFYFWPQLPFLWKILGISAAKLHSAEVLFMSGYLVSHLSSTWGELHRVGPQPRFSPREVFHTKHEEDQSSCPETRNCSRRVCTGHHQGYAFPHFHSTVNPCFWYLDQSSPPKLLIFVLSVF